MTTFLHVGLSNALLATLIALVAIAVSRRWQHPPLLHSLWILVLLKLLTPPLVTLPITRPLPADSHLGEAVRDAIPESAPASGPTVPVANLARESFSSDAPAARAWADSTSETADQPAVGADPVRIAPDRPLAGVMARLPWAELLALVWLAGSIVYFTLAIVRTARFRRMLRHAAPAPEALADEVRCIARRLGLCLTGDGQEKQTERQATSHRVELPMSLRDARSDSIVASGGYFARNWAIGAADNSREPPTTHDLASNRLSTYPRLPARRRALWGLCMAIRTGMGRAENHSPRAFFAMSRQ